MIAVVQRVTSSSVTVDGSVVGAIGPGLNVLLGVADGDEATDADYLAAKVANLRIFEDDQGRMNRSLLDTGGRMLVVSQFTLLGDCRKGRRPSFVRAAEPNWPNGFTFISSTRWKNWASMSRPAGSVP
jgi:D-tyrosyl-tRNA(Tyr) deacylase